MDFEVEPEFPLGETNMLVFVNSEAPMVFTSWVVDLVTFQFPEKIFVHFIEGESIPFTLVNNTDRTLNINLTGKFILGQGTIDFNPSQPTLEPFAAKELIVFIKPSTEEAKVMLVADDVSTLEPESILAIRPVERAMEPDPAHDLFDDDFSSNTMDDWDTTLGTWQVENGVAKGSSPRHLAFKYDVNEPERWTDYKFQVNTKLDSSDYPLVDWIKSYIYFRVSDTLNYYRFGLAQGFKAISLSKLVNDTLSILSNCDFNVKKGVWYNLSVEVIGNGIKCYLDGNLVISTEDTTFSSGGIGIGVTEDAYVNYYDDVVVRRILAPPER